MYEKLNIKKVVIAVLIGILLIVSIIVFVISKVGAHKNEIQEDANKQSEQIQSNTTIFTDLANTISIELDKKYNFVQAQNNEYLINQLQMNPQDYFM